jgi:WD40 repeat protein
MRLGTIRLRHQGKPTGVAFSPDGRHLVSTGWDNRIQFWEAKSGRLVRQLKCEGMNFAVAFSRDGSLLASVGDNRLRLWELTSGNMLYEKEAGSGRVYSVAFAPDSSTIATGGTDEWVRIWETTTGEVLHEFATEGGRDTQPVSYSPDGHHLASGSKNGTIRIWKTTPQAPPTVIENAHGRNVVSLAFSPDGRRLVSSGSRVERTDEGVRAFSEIFLWQVSDGSKLKDCKLPEGVLPSDVSLALSSDGTVLATSHPGRILIWDAESLSLIRVIEGERKDYGGGRSHGLAIAPDNRVLAAIANDHKVHLWDIATGDPLYPQEDTHHGGVLAIDTSPDAELVVTGGQDGDVHLWDVSTGRHVRKLLANDGAIRTVQFFPDGERVLAAGEFHNFGRPGFEGRMYVIRIRDGTKAREWTLPDRAMCSALSSDGKRVAVALGLGPQGFDDDVPPEIRVWDLAGDRELAVLKGHLGQIQQVQFDEDATILWSTSADGTIRKWNILNGEELEKLSLDGGRLFEPTINISNRRQFAIHRGLISAQPPEASLGQLAAIGLQGEEKDWLVTFSKRNPSLAVDSPNNALLAVNLSANWRSGANDELAILDFTSGRKVLAFELEDGVVRSLAFSPDGRTLYSGMDRGDILVWDVSKAYD